MADGKLTRIRNIADLKPGSILRPATPNRSPYSDIVVVDQENTHYFDPEENKNCTILAFRVARPYAYVSSPGTCCATVLTGVEEFSVTFERLKEHYVVVLTNEEKTYEFTVM